MAEQITQYAPDHVVIIGCGDIGIRTGSLWLSRGIPVHGVARSVASADRMQSAGITPHCADLDDPATLVALPVAGTLLYYFAPPPKQGVRDTRMQNFLAALKPGELPARVVYLSTSGVYGDQHGKQVTEQTPAAPQVDRAQRRFDAEQQLHQYTARKGLDLVVLRVGGIYGPGRLPEQRLRNQIPIIYEHLAPSTNRIHADDLARVCVAAGQRGRPGEIYNACDGTDSNMTEYFKLVADHLGLPRPPEIDWDEAEHTLSQGMLSYLRESRRMDNSKMLTELAVTLKYPTLQSWLASEQATKQ
jgi:nucleoside-diphosphate-sugar epimerase